MWVLLKCTVNYRLLLFMFFYKNGRYVCAEISKACDLDLVYLGPPTRVSGLAHAPLACTWSPQIFGRGMQNGKPLGTQHSCSKQQASVPQKAIHYVLAIPSKRVAHP